jgi:hypothetical protein
LFFTTAILFCTCVSNAGSHFDHTYKLKGISFHIICPNVGSINELTIIPFGLANDNTVIKRVIHGAVAGAEVADINVDGSPEIYVHMVSAGSGSYGELIAYSANNKKSLSEIYLPPLTECPINVKGYMGHDKFAIIENSLVRHFPIFKQGDTNAHPIGGMRQIHYKLVAGEATW